VTRRSPRRAAAGPAISTACASPTTSPIRDRVLADTSAWVEYLRATGSPVHLQLRHLFADEDRGHYRGRGDGAARRLLGRFELLPVEGLADYEAAAELHRRCQRAGETVRKLTDCLIAVVAIRAGAALLHRDQDFEVIARHTPLRVAG
jgi:predicted nucleic acid-binding protein